MIVSRVVKKSRITTIANLRRAKLLVLLRRIHGHIISFDTIFLIGKMKF